MLDNASPDGHHSTQERDIDLDGPAPTDSEQREHSHHPSLADDIGALVEDGKAYVQAEIAFQKSRTAYAAHELKSGAAFALVMFGLLHLALMGAVIGLIIALAPIMGAFAATGLMVAILLVGCAVFGWLALRRFKRISRTFDDPDDGAETGGDDE